MKLLVSDELWLVIEPLLPKKLLAELPTNLAELTRFGGRFTAWDSSRFLSRRSGRCGDAFVVHRGLLTQG